MSGENKPLEYSPARLSTSMLGGTLEILHSALRDARLSKKDKSDAWKLFVHYMEEGRRRGFEETMH